VVQQNASPPQMALAQLEQPDVSGPPFEHSLWAQPPEHSLEQALSA
jgi:hypothetical protein